MASESEGVLFEQDAEFCYYCQTFHYGEHAKFAMPANDRGWRKYHPDSAIIQAKMQAAEEEKRQLAEEGVGD